MLSTEQKKQIAEYMGVKFAYSPSPHYAGSYRFDDGSIFSPESDNGFSKVFKALVDECKKRPVAIKINKYGILVYDSSFDSLIFEGEFNNESICLSYLAVMESK